ncbi:MAG: chemotaxis response regulator protein-glutamate methylesterase [Bdellovibrionales bacterium]|nr:chemotaxis response regulator protein-glutamate methylesterase [Bdellovibrionales bacterium]
MKRMRSLTPYKKIDGGEFIVTLFPGDTFLSFHHSSQDCVGIYLKKVDLTPESFEKVMTVVNDYFKDGLSKVEMKIIALATTLRDVSAFFESKKFQSIKKIEKPGQVEVCFLPETNKVRVSIEPVVLKPMTKIEPTKFKVLVIDDSKTIRTILSKIFSSDPMFEVCAMAEKPSEVEALIQKHKPDVITLDIHMPEMDGVTLLKTIISPKYRIPTVMISSISMAEGPMVLDALENGAVDYIQKPEMSEIASVTPIILEKVRTAAMANTNKKSRRDKQVVQTLHKCNLDSLIVLGSSTGGTEAIREILTALPNNIPPMLIVQHIPAVFSLAFAKRMNDLCPFEVKEAENGDEVKSDRVLIAPGGQQMKLIHKNGKAFVEINDEAPVNRFKPSVDYMFLTVAKSLYTHTVAVILTGMGKDGAKGMLELRNLGVRTIAQDEETSVVFGMPKEAINIGGAEFVEPLGNIAERITLLTADIQKKSRKDAS